MAEVVYKYRYNVEAQIMFGNGDVEELTVENIGQFIIDYLYDENTMPAIYMNMTLKDSLIYKMTENQNNSTILLTVQKYVYEEDKAPLLYEDYIKSEFIYFIIDDYTKSRVSEDLDAEGLNFSQISIGLLDKDLVNNSKKTINGAISGDMLSIIYNIIKSSKNVLIEKFDHNTTLKQLLLPSLESKRKLVEYLNNMSCFYDTKYRYFNDFDTTYFLSGRGNNVQKKNDKYDTIYIDITEYQLNGSVYEGMITDSEKYLYKLNVSETNTDKMDDSLMNRTYSDIKGIDSSGEVSTVKLDNTDENITNEKIKNIKINNNNSTLLSNIKSSIDNSKIGITVNKTDIDTSVLTINRKYIIDASNVYGVDYNGQYLLHSKKEIYIRSGKEFIVDVALSLFKIAS